MHNLLAFLLSATLLLAAAGALAGKPQPAAQEALARAVFFVA